MNDGWDDDDDLDLDLTLTQDETSPATNDDDDGGGGGWEEDEELFEDDDDDDDVHLNVAADDDDDDDDDNNHNWGGTAVSQSVVLESPERPEDNTFGAGISLPVATVPPVAPSRAGVGPPIPTNSTTTGWGEDDDLNFGDDGDGDDDDDDDQTPAVPVAPVQPSVPAPTSHQAGWEEDLDLNFGDDVDDDDDNNKDMPTPAPAINSKPLFEQLEEYVNSLGRIQSSIDAVLEYEYNTPEKAQELVDYYTSRPALAEYTRTKEVPRMNYQVILPSGQVETSKDEIAQHHLPDHSLIARSANQSLLADLLHVLTGPDLVVRPQFLAICIAKTCQFRLHMGDQGRDMLQCNCLLQLSLPMPDGPRLDVASIRTTVAFSPHLPMVKFRVDKIVVTLKNMSKLEPVAEFLNMMEGHFEQLPGHEDLALHSAPADIFRDAFLENSQQLLTQSTQGMKSALKEMEAVIGLKSKLKAVKGGISKFLPNTKDLLAAEEEARTLAAERKQQQRFHQSPPPASRVPAPQPSTAPPIQLHHARPPPPPQPNASTNAAKGPRPQSILGGLVSSGWSALAKSVTIPDEDPAIYGPAVGSNSASQIQEPPSLYRKEDSTNTAPPQLYRPAPTVLPSPVVPTLYRKPEAASPRRPPPPRQLPQQQPPPTPPRHAQQPSRRPPSPGSQTMNPALAEQVEPLQQIAQALPDSLTGAPAQSFRDLGSAIPIGVSRASNDATVWDLQPSLGDDFGDGWDDGLDVSGDDDVDEVKESADSQSGIEKTEFGSNANEASTTLPVTLQDVRSQYSRVQEAVSAPQQSSPSPDEEPAGQVPTHRQTLPMQVESKPLSRALIQTLPIQVESKPSSRALIANIPYDPEDDIISTRKRWVNPRPNRPYLAI